MHDPMGPMTPARRMAALLNAAQTFLTGNPQLDPKAAIRRAVRTSSWQHDPDRLAAAEAKRARKRGRAICR